MSMRLMVIGCLTTYRDVTGRWQDSYTIWYSYDRILEAVHTAVETLKDHDLINDIKITAELNERCEYIYTLIGSKKQKRKNVAGIKKH